MMYKAMLTNIVDMQSLACDVDPDDEQQVINLMAEFKAVGLIPILLPVYQVQRAHYEGKDWVEDLYKVPCTSFCSAALEASFRLAYEGSHEEHLTVLICSDKEHADHIATIVTRFHYGERT
jgi:hypothetical protein